MQALLLLAALAQTPTPTPSPEPTPPAQASVVTVRGRRASTATHRTKLSADDARQVPGAQGDVVKAIETLAGVGPAAAGAGGLAVWGASPAQSRYYIDDIVVPRLFHLGGRRSVIASDAVRSVTLTPGALPVDYGRALGGSVQVRTRRAPKEEIGGFVGADLLDAGAGVHADFDGTRFRGTARKSLLNHIDLGLDDGASLLLPRPDYWDYHAALSRGSRFDGTWSLMSFGAGDALRRGAFASDPFRRIQQTRTLSFHRVGLRYARVRDGGGRHALLAWFGIDRDADTQRVGQSLAEEDQSIWRGGLRLLDRRPLVAGLALRSGLDLELTRGRFRRAGALTLPSREGDVTVFGLPPGDRVNDDAWTVLTVQTAAHLAAELQLFAGRLFVEAGVRLEPSFFDGERVVPTQGSEPAVGTSHLTLKVDPRLRLRWQVLDWLSAEAGVALQHQAPGEQERSPVFGNPQLGVGRALHSLATLAAQLWDSRLSVAATGFYIALDGLAARAPQANPGLARALVSDGEGRSYGVQLTTRADWDDSLFAWASYAFMRAERRQPGGGYRPHDLDQTHTVSVVAAWRPGHDLELGVRAHYRSGFPRTPVVAAYYNAGADAFEPIYGDHNSDRLPDFFELSLRLGWSRDFGVARLQLWLDLQNVTDRRNVEERVYDSDFSQRGNITGLPILPVLGFRVVR